MPTTKQMLPYLATSIVAVMGVYLLALLSGTDFSQVAAPPALFSPIPGWLFALYSVGAAAIMFPLFKLSLKFKNPKLAVISVILLGLALMTPQPFIVSDDTATIMWLTIVHISCVTPLIARAWTLPSIKPLATLDNVKGT